MVADHFVALVPYRDKMELREYCASLTLAVEAFLKSRRLVTIWS